MTQTILVVEDEPALQETLAYNLQKLGYAVQVCGNGVEAIEIARQQKPDAVVLDVMLPGLDGFEVCKILRRESNVPILMLTARDDEIDRVLGLELGADDYLPKPFSMRELMARIKAQLRRTEALRQEMNTLQLNNSAPASLRFGNLVINPTRREVTLNTAPLSLKPKEYELLLHLAERRGRMLTRESILKEVWGWDFTGDSRTVDVHVRWLRQKIEENPAEPQRIVTVRGGGYRFEG